MINLKIQNRISIWIEGFFIIGIILACNKDEPALQNNSIAQNTSAVISTGWQKKTLIVYSAPANAVYIDPTVKNTGCGTEDMPYSGSIFLVQYKQPWKESTTYLFKRGTVFNVKYKLDIKADRVTLGAYGTGAAPVIFSSVHGDKVVDMGSTKDGTIRDLEIYTNDNQSIVLNFQDNSGGTVINCKIHGGEWGIHTVNTTGLVRVLNSEFYNTGDDGCFFSNLDSLEFGGTSVHNVNTKYLVNRSQTYSGGDCLQVHNIKRFNIHDNILDHSGSGNKFCIIVANDNGLASASGTIERNLIERDKSNILVYLYNTVDHPLIRYNKFVNGDIGIYNHSTNPEIYYNEFINISKQAFLGGGSSKNSRIINNTFYNVNTLISSYIETITFKNNIVFQVYGMVFDGSNNIAADYNCYYKITEYGFGGIGSHSIRQDPLFSNSVLYEFNLLPASPCIKKGLNVLGSYSDIFGNLVPKGSNPDMGAHEYDPGI